MSEPFIAEVKLFAGNFAPPGYGFCDGQLLPISQNTALFSLVGTTFGGDGETTFGLPNLQGRAPMGVGNGPGLTPRTWGQTGGSETIVLTQAQMPGHRHVSSSISETVADSANPEGGRHAENASIPKYHDPTNLVGTPPTNPAGGGQGHNNLAPYQVINYIIALIGIYPPPN